MTRSVAVGLAILGVASASHANLLTNGSFEDSSVSWGSNRNFVTLGSGSTTIDGWTVTGTNIDYIYRYWDASDGTKSIDLNGGGAGGLQLSQQFFANAGTYYTVSFDMAGNPVSAQTIKTLLVSAAGQSQTFTFDTTGKTTTDMGWQRQSWSFWGNNQTTTLSFASTISGAYGPAIDNVCLTPEPSFGLLVFGLVVPLVIGLRRRRAVPPAVER